MADPVPGQSPFRDARSPEEDPAPHALLEPVTGLLGTWVGSGHGGYPTLDGDFAYRQQVTFSHDGRPFLHYEARAWLVDADGTPLRPSARETGWWRLQPDGHVEALITQPTGVAELLTGRSGSGSADLVSGQVALTPTAKQVDASRRRYTLTDADTLDFHHDLQAVGQPMQRHLSARLHRTPAP
ncbi:FABP family protein [Streptomyces sp. RKND-216]|uniref:FABP family protein n=1 Tax=Streptomyces sp. RKND-216 TaxID=2562581 RepID=UPI00109D8F33|nr:FABP family protein [Streptomyces sp. RKND-216]THA23946.1 FABP family protein [Streptomyces sp. RKND-216]